MNNYKAEFIEFAIANNALGFGEFTLKSGRVSPYFFNAGVFHTGLALQKLGQFYAAAILASDSEFDMLFGPAYKGIPLAASTAIALAAQQCDVPYCFNRKEAKDHGEGGNIVGAKLQGNVLVIDDVITAGTACREAIELIKNYSAKPAGFVIAVDRQERGEGELSAIAELEQTTGTKVISIINLHDIINYLQTQPDKAEHLAAIEKYWQQYKSA